MAADKKEGTVTISIEEYEQLLAASKQLEHLEANGVDNWPDFSWFEEDAE